MQSDPDDIRAMSESPVLISRPDRLAAILMDQNMSYEHFEVMFGTQQEADEVIASVEKLGFRAEMDMHRSQIHIFRDTQARLDATEAARVLKIKLASMHEQESLFAPSEDENFDE